MSGIRMRSATREEHTRDPVATYDLESSGPKTVLELALSLRVDSRDGSVKASMEIETDGHADADAALDKLAEWLERSAAAVRGRKPGLSLPVGDIR